MCTLQPDPYKNPEMASATIDLLDDIDSDLGLGSDPSPPRKRSWVFTLNHPTDQDRASLKVDFDMRVFACMVIGHETGASGTPHLQGCVHFANARTFSGVKGLGGPWARMHLEPMHGTWKQASDYCKKDTVFDVWGVEPRPGTRTDLARAVEAAEAGHSLRVAIREGSVGTWQGVRGYDQLVRTLRPLPPQWRGMKCMWISGPTGCGKTVLASHVLDRCADGESLTYCPTSLCEIFWMGYAGETCVLIDDVCKISEDRLQALHQILGGGRCNVRVNGGVVPCAVTTVVITSHAPPQQLFADAGCSHRWPEMCRRMNRGVFRIPDGLQIAELGVDPDPHHTGAMIPMCSTVGKALLEHFQQDALYPPPAPLPAIPTFGSAYASHTIPGLPSAGAEASLSLATHAISQAFSYGFQAASGGSGLDPSA